MAFEAKKLMITEKFTSIRRLADAQHPHLFTAGVAGVAIISGAAFVFFFWSKKKRTASVSGGVANKLVLEAASSPSRPIVPPIASISIAELMSGADAATASLCVQLRHHGFAVLVPDAGQIALLQSLLAGSGREFFALDQEKKGRSKEVNSIGYTSNLGYVNVKDVREYIKLRPSDPKYLWPTEPASFKTNFDRAFSFMKDLSWKCFTDLAKYMPDGKQRLLVQDTVDVLASFVESKSSISLIHYYPNLPADKTACDEHRDTGIVTLIVASDVPGLELQDKATGEFVTAEKVARPWEIICIIGEKIPQFTRSDLFPGTLHRVTSRGERFSMAFLLDVAK